MEGRGGKGKRRAEGRRKGGAREGEMEGEGKGRGSKAKGKRKGRGEKGEAKGKGKESEREREVKGGRERMLCEACLATSWRKARKIRSGSATNTHRKAKEPGTCKKLTQERTKELEARKKPSEVGKGVRNVQQAHTGTQNSLGHAKKPSEAGKRDRNVRKSTSRGKTLYC